MVKKRRYLAIDTETTGTDFWRGAEVFAVSMCDDHGSTWFWEWDVDPLTRKVQLPEGCLTEILEVIGRYDYWIFHNAKFDIRGLEAYGLKLITAADSIHDTLLMSHVLDSGEDHGLKTLALKYLDILDDDEKELHDATKKARLVAKKRHPDWKLGEAVLHDTWLPKALDPNSEVLSRYATRDAIRTMRLFLMFQAALKETGLEKQYERERALLPVVYRMEERGIHLNPIILSREQARYGQLAQDLGEKIQRKVGKDFNVRSGPKLAKYLHNDLALPILKQTAKGSPSTDADTLKTLAELYPQHQILGQILSHRKAGKAVEYLADYYQRATREEGNRGRILRPNFNQTGTDTTRFSCSNPNAHNVSTQAEMPLRAVFGPRPGHFWYDIDYENLELRLMAYDAGEEALIQAFQSGVSVHLVIAELLHGPLKKWCPVGDYKKHPYYKSTKNGNFAIIYGASNAKADATYGLDGAYDRIRSTFTKLDAWMDAIMREARKNHCIYTMSGYRLSVPQERPYVAVNYRIQGTAGDVMKNAMLNVDAILPNDWRMILTVHDELVIEVSDKSATCFSVNSVVEAMEQPGEAIGVTTPVSVSIVRQRWSEPKPVKLIRTKEATV